MSIVSSDSRLSRHKLLVPTALFTIAFLLRWAMAARSGLSCDEALCLFIANLPKLTDTIAFLRFHESHPPLFYLLLRGWSALFGTGDNTLLLLPVLAGSASAVVAYFAARQVAGFGAALAAGILVCVSPGLLEYSSQVRPYALLQTLMPLSCLLLWQIRQGASPLPRWIGWTSICVAMVYLHNWCWIAIASQSLCFLVSAFAERATKASLRAIAALAMALTAVVLLYLPWLPVLAYQASFAGYGGLSSASVVPKVTVSVFSLLEFTTQSRLGTSQKRAMVLWSIVGVLLLLARRSRTPRNGASTASKPLRDALLLWAGTPVVALAVAAVLSVKNDLLFVKSLSILLPGIYVVLGIALHRLFRLVVVAAREKSSARLPAVLSLSLASALIAMSVVQQNREQYSAPRSGAREAAKYVSQRVKQGDVILIVPEWLCSSFNWYYKADTPQICYPAQQRQEVMAYDHVVDRYSDPRPFIRVTRQLAEVRRQGYDIWLITAPAMNKDLGNQSVPLTPALRLETGGYIEYGGTRAVQMLRFLTELYGEGNVTAPAESWNRDNAFEVMLYHFRGRRSEAERKPNNTRSSGKALGSSPNGQQHTAATGSATV